MLAFSLFIFLLQLFITFLVSRCLTSAFCSLAFKLLPSRGKKKKKSNGIYFNRFKHAHKCWWDTHYTHCGGMQLPKCSCIVLLRQNTPLGIGRSFLFGQPMLAWGHPHMPLDSCIYTTTSDPQWNAATCVKVESILMSFFDRVCLFIYLFFCAT